MAIVFVNPNPNPDPIIIHKTNPNPKPNQNHFSYNYFSCIIHNIWKLFSLYLRCIFYITQFEYTCPGMIISLVSLFCFLVMLSCSLSMIAPFFYFTDLPPSLLIFHYSTHQVQRQDHLPAETLQVHADHSSNLNSLPHSQQPC